jgi:UDP-3-O-[3-hydroxymyristoyl] glucosamine N-acyltransferase
MGVSFSIEELAREICGTFKGDGSLRISGIGPLDSAKEGDLTFVTNPRYVKKAGTTGASAILSDRELPGVQKTFLLAKNPYATLARLIELYHPSARPEAGVQDGAWVHPTATIHPQASIYPGACVMAGAEVGAKSILYPGVVVGDSVVIGEGCILYPNVSVREKCVLGNRVILQPGVVIGADGFGFAPDQGVYVKIPQIGNVVLEDDVEIGANTCIDRGALGSTRIGKGTKMDDLVMIGHNVIVGQNTIIVSQTGISGSTQIGNHVVMGGQVGLAGHLKIGDNVTLATRTGVMEDIPEKGVYWGSPSSDMATEMKNVAAYRQLPEMIKRLRKLEKEVAKLTGGETHG